MPIAADVILGSDVRIFQPELVNLYGCSIGDESKIGAFVEIQKNAVIGARCKISSRSFGEVTCCDLDLVTSFYKSCCQGFEERNVW